MHLKIGCDGKSYKILKFWTQLNKQEPSLSSGQDRELDGAHAAARDVH